VTLTTLSHTILPRDAMLERYMLSSCVRRSVRLSRVGTEDEVSLAGRRIVLGVNAANESL